MESARTRQFGLLIISSSMGRTDCESVSIPRVSQMTETFLKMVCLTCCSCSSLRKVRNLGSIASMVFFLPIAGQRCSSELARESVYVEIYF
jgi:hypothetical protein